MNANDAQLITRMATDLATIASGVKTLTAAVPALDRRLTALESEFGTDADLSEARRLLSTIEETAPAVAAAADSAQKTADAATSAPVVEQPPTGAAA